MWLTIKIIRDHLENVIEYLIFKLLYGKGTNLNHTQLCEKTSSTDLHER